MFDFGIDFVVLLCSSVFGYVILLLYISFIIRDFFIFLLKDLDDQEEDTADQEDKGDNDGY